MNEEFKELEILRLGSSDRTWQYVQLFKAMLFGKDKPFYEDKEAEEVFNFIADLVFNAYHYPLPDKPYAMERPMIIEIYKQMKDILLHNKMVEEIKKGMEKEIANKEGIVQETD